MKYVINYKENGQIIGFAKGDTDLNIEVSNSKWVEGQSYNKIIVDGKNITFEKVDWRTPEEIEEIRVQNINSYTQSFIYSKYSQPKQSSANLGVYDEAYKQEMVAFIKRIVDLSNEAITNGTSFEDYKAMLNE